jgi:hypothetical protein
VLKTSLHQIELRLGLEIAKATAQRKVKQL